MPASVLGLCGNPRPGSRTLAVVERAVDALVEAIQGQNAGTLDLITMSGDLFTFGAPPLQSALERVLRADVLVVGSPVYKATYTGVLKAFCDHIAHNQLLGKLAIPLMVGGSMQHFLALDAHLRPLLVELGATCATPGLYVVETELEGLDDQLHEYVESIKRPFVDAVREGV